MNRVSLVDPVLYQSSYVNPNPQNPIKINFWKRFNFLNFLFNILLPISVIILIMFILKGRYWNKKAQWKEIETLYHSDNLIDIIQTHKD